MADTIDKGKKRKRRTDGSSKPSKKVAIEEDRKIKVSLQDGDKWAPVIGTNTLHVQIRSAYRHLLLLPTWVIF
jgi:DNA-directed RNA polymerase I subunit RPA49